MRYADMMVHLDPSDQGRRRLEASVELARSWGASLTGLYVIPQDPISVHAAGMPAAGGVITPEIQTRSVNRFREGREATKGALVDASERAGIQATWFATEGLLPETVTAYARLSDLIIVGQDAARSDDTNVASGLAASLAMEAGRPTLVIPHAGQWNRIGSRVMVALHDALPFLRRAESVNIVTVADRPVPQAASGDGPRIDVVTHLARHGIDAEWRHEASDLGVGDEILARITDISCDLLVMGAYGHSRLRELVFGGTTRQLLRHMTAPVLLSH